MTYLKLVPTLVVAACLGGSIIANAENVAEKFSAMDADASGLVSSPEFVAYATRDGQKTAETAQAKFFELAGRDGMLSLEELEAAYATAGKKDAHRGDAGS